MSQRNMAIRIRAAREAKHWSQDRLAKEVGVTQPAVGQWERLDSGTSPSMDNLVRMAAILGTTVDWLAEGRGLQFGDPPKIEAQASDIKRIAVALEEIATQVRHMRQTLDRLADNKSD